jgi:hypothetical protein
MKAILVVLVVALAIEAKPTNWQEGPADHHAAVVTRGEHVMGFSQEKTTHHFLLHKDGGTISITANDPKDTDSRDMIRMHLSHIAQMFAGANFDAPMLIHGTTPPGVPVMKQLRAQITYRYQETDSGGQVRIQSSNPKAIAAIHGFLRFQIKEHQTGDSGDIAAEPKP